MDAGWREGAGKQKSASANSSLAVNMITSDGDNGILSDRYESTAPSSRDFHFSPQFRSTTSSTACMDLTTYSGRPEVSEEDILSYVRTSLMFWET